MAWPSEVLNEALFGVVYQFVKSMQQAQTHDDKHSEGNGFQPKWSGDIFRKNQTPRFLPHCRDTSPVTTP